jgi:hypothetical protein
VRGRDKRAGTRKKYFVYTKEKKEEKGRRKKQKQTAPRSSHFHVTEFGQLNKCLI